MENPISKVINAGCYVFNPSTIRQIPPGQAISVERETFPSLLTLGVKIYGYLDNSYWLDVGTPEALIKGSADIVTGRAK
jgi:mannose-1-phosphate guanylyltransferase